MSSLLLITAILLGAYGSLWLTVIVITSVQGTATWTSGPDLESLLLALWSTFTSFCLLAGFFSGQL